MLDGLRAAEDRIRHHPVEHFVVLDDTGRERGEITGSATQVNLAGHYSEDVIERNRPIATHNHPNSRILGLSGPDISSSFADGFSEMRAVIPDGRVCGVRFGRVDRDKRMKIAMIHFFGCYGLIYGFLGIGVLCLVLSLLGRLIGNPSLGTPVVTVGLIMAAPVLVATFRPAWIMELLLILYGERGKISYGEVKMGERVPEPRVP